MRGRSRRTIRKPEVYQPSTGGPHVRRGERGGLPRRGKEATLERIESEIAAGDLGKARDRLQGLIGTYPDDLALRSRLAEVYWKLQYPAMAGCYWYLEENQTNDTRRAIAAFEKRCGNDPWIIWQRLKFKGDPEELPTFARQRLQLLLVRCVERDPRRAGKHLDVGRPVPPPAQRLFISIGCLTTVILVAACLITGLVTIGWWLIRLVFG